jgi:superfamily II DNA or RNA helicase
MIPDRLHYLLNHHDWRSHFDERMLSRGLEYARQQRVRALVAQPLTDADDADDACLLDGEIHGSGRQVYQCTIDVRSQDRWFVLDTRCSCPVGSDCKHAVAMLATAAGQPPERWPGAAGANAAAPVVEAMPAWLANLHALHLGHEPSGLLAWEYWLQNLAPRPEPQREAAPERRFGILLRGSHPQPVQRLLACAAWMRPAKSKAHGGGLVDPQPFTLDSRHGPVPLPAGGWPAASAMALATLAQGRHVQVGGPSWTCIEASHEEQALEHLLQHYPAYFERGAVPLQRGETLPLQWYWQESEDGSQRLSARVDESADTRLLLGAGLWYVQPQQRRYGRVDGDLRLFNQLGQIPSLQPEHVASIRQRLQRVDASHALPAPAERELAPVTAVVPVPVLQLRVVPLVDWQGRTQQTGVASCLFDYDGTLLSPGAAGVERVLRQGRLLQIQRHVKAEKAAFVRLQKAGLRAAAAELYHYRHDPKQFTGHQLVLRPNPRKPPLAPDDWGPVIKQLADAGFRIDYEAGFPHDEQVEIEQWHAELQASGNQWFDVSLGIDVGGERIDLLPILRRLLADPDFPRKPPAREKKNASWRVALDEQRSVQMPLARLRALIEPLLEWLEGDGELRLHRSQAPTLAAMDEHLHWRGGELLRQQLQTLRQREHRARTPRGFKASLRPYQRDGLAWLDFLGAAGLGGILADDMGLGKTVQVLAHILGEQQRGRLEQPALVVAPTSLVGNWQDEAARFAPALKVLVLHGADRAGRYDNIATHDLIITTYPLLPRDRERLLEQRFALLVLDEAQAIKNANSQAARVVREIPAARRLAMTGTPLENHLGELWAQFDAVEPGLLGSQRQFARLYRAPIEKHGDSDRQQRLNRRIGPLLLRRRKDDVLTDLPAKTEIVRTLELDGDQRALYETLRLAQHQRVQQAVKERGLAQSGIIVLDALLKLRQACCDPRLVKLASARKLKQSAKLDALLELLDGLLGEGRRVLLFSQFTEMLALIEAALAKRRIAYQILTGQTPARERSALVKRFQRGDVPVFLISLKAGGVGLNLTAADTVIHYDPWWNPAVEAQATDRAHRIGQDKPVFVYRLICAGTVEEKIQAMQSRKAELARAVLEEGGATTQLRFDEADLAALFAPLPAAGK